ncbi:MAG: T9SS type A sorting domain-containing protein [Flavobacterium sp.]
MKKITLLLMFTLFAMSSGVNAQSDYVAALAAQSSSQVRGPQGTNKYQKSVWLITATELANTGFVANDVLNAIAFNYTVGHNAPITGTINVYLQNTTATTNTKSNTWTTTITGMTSVYNGAVTLPSAIGQFAIPFTSNFIYTGGGIFVAFDYQNASNPLATISSTLTSNTDMTIGAKVYSSATTNGTTLTNVASAHRPVTIFGKSVACARPLNVAVPSTTLTTANLTFTTSNPANITFGPYDFNPSTAGTTTTGITSPYTITGLTPSTAYEVYTKSDCGAFTGLSSFTDPVSFHTIFQPADPTYNTSFEVDNYPNMGWVADAEANGSDWFINYGGTGSTLVQNGLYSAVSLANATANAAGWLYSRGVNLTAGSTVTVSYYDKIYLSTATAPAVTSSDYVLSYGTDQTAASQTNVLATITGATNTSFALHTYTFTPTTTGVYYFSFLNQTAANSAGTEGLILDNFTVTQALSNNAVLESKFSTYPNPAKDIINITNSTEATISAIEITDTNGRVVKNVKLSDVSEAQINIADLSVGVYMMKITSDKGILTKKVIKE